MRLVILGSGGYHPNNARHTLCSVIPEARVILDAATAFFRIGPYLDEKPWNVFLTHAHLDHVIGLTYYWSLVQKKTFGPVRVWGSEKTLDAIRRFLFSEPLFPKMPPYEFVPIGIGETVSIESQESRRPLRVTAFGLSHPGGAQGYRLDWEQNSLAYVTDTTIEASPNYKPLVEGVKLLVHEAFCGRGYEDAAMQMGHVTVTQAAEIARDCRVDQLVVVHINPLADTDTVREFAEARSIFRNLVIAEDNLVIDF